MKDQALGLWGLVILAGTLSGCNLLPAGSDSSTLTATNLSVLPPCVDDDCNCEDFRDQELAQIVLNAIPGDPFQLDRDGNGFACG